MKIYINNFNLDILNDVSEVFKEYLIKTETHIKLYTDEGIYQIDDQKICFLDTCDEDIQIINNYYKNFTVIVDPSSFNKNIVSSIHGQTHLSFQIKKKYYKMNKNSNVQMIIKYCLNDNKFVPNDIYFESDKNIDINDLFIKKEIIEFLSMLN